MAPATWRTTKAATLICEFPTSAMQLSRSLTEPQASTPTTHLKFTSTRAQATDCRSEPLTPGHIQPTSKVAWDFFTTETMLSICVAATVCRTLTAPTDRKSTRLNSS